MRFTDETTPPAPRPSAWAVLGVQVLGVLVGGAALGLSAGIAVTIFRAITGI